VRTGLCCASIDEIPIGNGRQRRLRCRRNCPPTPVDGFAPGRDGDFAGAIGSDKGTVGDGVVERQKRDIAGARQIGCVANT
jgi:hypothetical protein